VITAVFFAISAIPIFLWLPERAQPQTLPPGENYFSMAVKKIRETIRATKRFKEFIKYMIAFLIYNDGIIMALNFAAIIGAVLFGMEQTDLIIFIIIVQISNIFGAYAFGRWVDSMGGKRALALSIVMMIVAILWIYFNQSVTGFYFIGILAGFAMAGTQSISRTMVSFFAPRGQSAEFYGFFAFAGRTSSFIGPTVYGILAAEMALYYEGLGESVVVAEQLGQRAAILSISVFLFIGLFLLSFVNEKRAREMATAQ